MKQIVSLTKDINVSILKEKGADGILIGTSFSLYTPFEVRDIIQYATQAHELDMEVLVALDDVLKEDDLPAVYTMLNELRDISIDGFVVGDLGALNVLKKAGYSTLLFDGGTLLANSLDTAFMRKKNVHPILAKECTLEEILSIARENQNDVSVHLLGRPLSATSKRHFLSSYFSFLNQANDPRKETYSIVEENRQEAMPIIENQRGTRIYVGEIEAPLNEYNILSKCCQYGFLTSETLNVHEVYALLEAVQLAKDGKIKEGIAHLQQLFPQETFSSAYLYKKTNITK